MSDTSFYVKELLEHHNWRTMHMMMCVICKRDCCLDRALYDAGRDDLIHVDDDGYHEIPEFIRRRAADKLNLAYQTMRDWWTDKTVTYGGSGCMRSEKSE